MKSTTFGPKGLGFGTAYEKFVLGQILTGLVHNLGVKSVCEYPFNNLMGNNSEAFERSGCVVSRLTEVSDFDQQHDLVWNFCEFERAEDPKKVIENMTMLSREYLLIVTQNSRNMGVPLHFAYHFLVKKRWDHGSIKLMSHRSVLKILGRREDINVVEIGFFDIPWFILDVYECGNILKHLVPKSFIDLRDLRESIFEGSPDFMKPWLAHHSYILCRKAERT